MNRPEVTVAIPSSGRWTLLARTVRSALAQTGPDVEIVVALDTAEDDSPPAEIAVLRDSRVRLTRAAERGLSHARNAAIQAANGQWIAFLDDDDLWAPTKLERQLRTAEHGADFVYASAVVVDEALTPLEVQLAPAPGALARDLLQRNPVPAGASNVIVRSDVVRALGGLDPRFSHLADWDLWIRLTASARPASVPEILVAHVRHPGSMLFQDGDVHKEFVALRRKHAGYAASLNGRFDESMLLAWLHARYRAGGYPGRARRLRLRHPLASHPRLRRLLHHGDWAEARQIMRRAGASWRPSGISPAAVGNAGFDWLKEA